ncbi:M48 family metallopeptidase [Parasphingorhabdus flavimaris]|mgnify:CR=1 FL=1|uniref:M48 family metallopeptidase n=1 Tax=Parasphingorhabdus flavimaris TaxID=266812 RepID=A0ABX2N4B9_9SPHN|nr:M48 family metallopeptidase [Parasphingorhabdus flavimaris]NVD28509.1 M48 family metallopeptidase [Parasphingorhabdus flavimaris]|tara:strand:- start:2435 stop:3730 length:1296 start_codon:yes stop_codon:yes gene_type:complete
MSRLLLFVIAAMLIAGLPTEMLFAQSGSAAFDVEQASRAYIDTLQGADLEKSNSYFEGGYWLILWGALVGILVDFLILQSRLSARFRDWAERVTSRKWLQPALYALPYIIVGFLIALPWTIYTDFFREQQYDLMSLDFGSWFGEQMVGLVISLIMFPLLVMAIFAVIRRAPKTWWIWGTGVIAIFLFIGMMLGPIFISPLFNEYNEMAEGPMRDKIVAMAAEYDIPAENIYVFDQSKQHKRISANVSGIGPTIRISLNDNLLERTDPDEVAAVMGHELGHYVLGHIWRTVFILSLIMAVGLFVTALVAPRLIERHGGKWGVRSISDPAAIPLLSLILTAYFFAATPALNSLVRITESEADQFGLDTAREPDGFAKVAMRLSEYRKIEPGPVEEMLFFDHPSGATRVRMAMQWKADNVANPVIQNPGKLEKE